MSFADELSKEMPIITITSGEMSEGKKGHVLMLLIGWTKGLGAGGQMGIKTHRYTTASYSDLRLFLGHRRANKGSHILSTTRLFAIFLLIGSRQQNIDCIMIQN